jgi:hypothetical protein
MSRGNSGRKHLYVCDSIGLAFDYYKNPCPLP